MTSVRRPAVAGLFYPEGASALEAMVRNALSEAGAAAEPAAGPAPKAIIAPHAGYVYSGPIAASAYARLRVAGEAVRRVVLLGPCHRVPLQGIAVPSVEAFETPLGRVAIDRAAIDEILRLPQVRTSDAAHVEEHSLEVHLPFLQTIFRDFRVIPMVVGECTIAEVAEVLARLWGGSETRIVVSSDLSHYLDYASARRLDAETCRAIELLDGHALAWEQACGRLPIAGVLEIARRKHLTVRTLDLRNSGDTAGDRRRVVGYGAWMFTEPDATTVGDGHTE
jgi:MEMO1 family protein